MTVGEQTYKVVGTQPVRHDGVDKVTGRAKYGVDASMPGMVWGKVLRSPHARARIISIDTSRAETADGILAVTTGSDYPDTGPSDYMDERAIARNRVTYAGQAVAAVAAISAHDAEEALRLIKVEYETLTPILDVQSAMAKDAPIILDELRTETSGSFGNSPTNIAKHIIHEEGDVEAGMTAVSYTHLRAHET